MSIQQERLVSLIEFVAQSARLRSSPKSSVTQHENFALYEHQLHGLPAVALNLGNTDAGDEIWLSVNRLHETKPPEVASPILKPWISLTQNLADEPNLRGTVVGENLIVAGTHRSSRMTRVSKEDAGKPSIDPEAAIVLAGYDKAAIVLAQFATYLAAQWRPWAEEEKLRRRTIQLYAKLFTLKQFLEGSIVEKQLELVWGVGVGIWNCDGTIVGYPLVGRLVELVLNPISHVIEIRPRDVDARIELDWYASVDNPGVAQLEKAAKSLFETATTTFSPFDRGTFEPLLRTAVTHLDANGIYWPDRVPVEDRSLPKSENHLKVTDTWVVFARPRTNNQFLQDLEKLKQAVEETSDYPPAVAAVVTDPSTDNPPLELPAFRGVSASYHTGGSSAPGEKKSRDLYFPKPFNDEQVRIVQLLDVSDGVVVQGPPGTGKTHTIANVICHYLAEGKRVLVTSMKDPALVVLREQLPDEIRPLAISLLTSEQEGMKQFEHAIQKIASEVQSLDRNGTAREIRYLDEAIDSLHGNLSRIDHQVVLWVKKNLAKITLESEAIDPQDAAREVVESVGQFEWILDALGVEPEFAPQVTDDDVLRLREARRALGRDIDYLGASLPQLVEFPDSKVLLQMHQDLAQFQTLKQEVEEGHVPALADSGQEALTLAELSLNNIATLRNLRDEVIQAKRPWTAPMRKRLRIEGVNDLLQMLEVLGEELGTAMELRNSYIKRPVSIPANAHIADVFVEAVANLAEGKSAFGLKGLFGKAEYKKLLEAVEVLGNKPSGAEEWSHVKTYIDLLNRFRELALRWNTLAQELDLDMVSAHEPEGGPAAAQSYSIYLKVKAVVKVEQDISAVSPKIFLNWPHAREIADDPQLLDEFEKALRHHLTKSRLANVWAIKERFQKVLQGRNGRVIEEIRRFLAETVGNPAIGDAQMQAKWSALMAELQRVFLLGRHLADIRDACEKVKASGAPQYAKALAQPLDGKIDSLLPDNWRNAWRLRRLASHLDSIDAQEVLKKLAKERQGVENDLSRAYRDIVVRRTWLKLAENASPSIRAALQAYLTAIQKIGKGSKGSIRAVRYRRDARKAAAQANPAVPCWIMPHYRVSESLPAELGCFDLVIIDEASQSDLTALPALLRAQKVLIVGDDKQVSPEGVGIEEAKIVNLMARFLGNQVPIYRPQMSPVNSIYDLFKVACARSAVMLREHFRSVGPIIEYSKREFYNHEIRPLRVPKASERLDPPLIDVVVTDGFRKDKDDVNLPEVRFIVDEIKALAEDPHMAGRSIGVVSLIGDKQALAVWERLTDELGLDLIQRHRIACGDARTFQGKERDIMFLSMVSAPNNVGAPPASNAFAQRYNVAASRARDRMYLVRSVQLEHLSKADRLRIGLISHFSSPYAQDETRVDDLRKLCESPFEREMYDELTQRGYWVTPQVEVGHYRIDMVVEGNNDTRLAVECDGDRHHGPDKWADDMQRQRVLERAGWVFWRCFASTFLRRRKGVLNDLVTTLTERGIEPVGAKGAPRSVHTEHRTVNSSISTRHDPAPSEDEGAKSETVVSSQSASTDSAGDGAQRAHPGSAVRGLASPQQKPPQSKAFKRQIEMPLTNDRSDLMEELINFCGPKNLKLVDNRPKGGALWVRYVNPDGEFAKQFRDWGMKFAVGKGWWLK